ncbi:GNAT family N-acetyltransferase [Niallia sp. 03133]|uniref:GNAT family N-acetyltransferase n=1 Tax=Niallia sp. 03133 TaxID=3458060 RepID=UPI004044AABB
MNQLDISIEELSSEDKEEAVGVLVLSYEQYKNSYTNIQEYYDYIEHIRASLDNPLIDQVLIAKMENEVVGTLQIFTDGFHAYGDLNIPINAPVVRLLGVHPKIRRSGIARKLLVASTNYTRVKGASALYLHTSEKMPDAIRLYERFGFVRSPEYDYDILDFTVMCYRYDL